MLDKEVVKKLLDINNKYINYDLKVDKRLGKNKDIVNNWTKHHIIPASYEKIPNLVFFWTIRWLKNNNIKEYWFKIKWTTLYINESMLLIIWHEDHAELHAFLELQKKALFFLEWIEKHYNHIYRFTFKNYLKTYADRKKHQDKINNDFWCIKTNKYNNLDILSDELKNKLKEEKKKIKDGTRQTKILENKANNVKYNVMNFLSKNTIIKNNNINNIIDIIAWKNNSNFLEESKWLIRKRYLKESAELKAISPNKYQIWNMLLLRNIITKNLPNINNINKNIIHLFDKWLTKALKRVPILIDSSNKIVSGIELIAYLYYTDKDYIDFNYKILDNSELIKINNYLSSKKKTK